MPFKILICGLPGAGKTTLANKLADTLIDAGFIVCSLNADELRNFYDDWDFSADGRSRQATRMRNIADESAADYVIADFVAPLDSLREIYNANYVIFIDTIKEGRFANTNALFSPPTLSNKRVTSFDPLWVHLIATEVTGLLDYTSHKY